MAFDNKEAALAARAIITDKSPAAVGMAIPRIQAMIPTALELWQREISTNPSALALMQSLISVSLSAGEGDLTNYVNGVTAMIDLEDLRRATVYTTINGVRTPFTWVASQQQLNNGRQLGGDSPALFLDGFKLKTRSIAGSLTAMNTPVEFTVADYPQTVAEIPMQLQESFVLVLARLALLDLQQSGV